MILVCDSGSTKADWVILSGKKIISEFQTEGLNPVHLSEDVLFNKISSAEKISSSIQDIGEVNFFGAGCGNTEGKSRMQNVLRKIFPGASVRVENDLYAAALATAGSQKGVIAILGTGSNCCYYDGTTIHLKNFGLGYILGDEGSGAWFGKKLIRAFLYKQLPASLETSFFSEFNLDKEKIVDIVYRKSGANLFLSSFMPFIIRNRENEYVSNLLRNGVREFIDTNVKGIEESKTMVIHFVGSVAKQLEKEIRESGEKSNLLIGQVIGQPMEGLLNYYSRG